MFFKKLKSANEADLIKTVQGFEIVYRKYFERLYTICHHSLGDEDAAQNIVQDVFRSVWERRDVIDITGFLENYLVRAVKLETIDYFRKRALQSRHEEFVLHHSTDFSNCTEESIFLNDLTEQVTLLVDQLPAQCRQVYKLSRERGFSNKEIATELLISEKTVESHITKALAFLRLQLSE